MEIDPVSFAAGLGHDQYPCLSKEYSPQSRIPCIDFSPWICERIANRDLKSLGEWLWRIVEANPGLGSGEADFKPVWTEISHTILTLPVDRFVGFPNSKARTELLAAMMMIRPHDDLGGFILASKASRFVAAAMFPHSLELREIEQLVSRANRFIKRMRRDVPFWEEVELFNLKSIRDQNPSRTSEQLEFCSRFSALPLGSRVHFFDAISTRTGEPDATFKLLEQATTYETRKYGLHGERSATAIINAGLFVKASNPSDFLRVLTRQQIQSLMDAASATWKKSWQKEKLIEEIIRQRPEAPQKVMNTSFASQLNPQFESVARWAQTELEATVPLFELLLGFAFDEQHG